MSQKASDIHLAEEHRDASNKDGVLCSRIQVTSNEIGKVNSYQNSLVN